MPCRNRNTDKAGSGRIMPDMALVSTDIINVKHTPEISTLLYVPKNFYL
jgi:hypothetical protein